MGQAEGRIFFCANSTALVKRRVLIRSCALGPLFFTTLETQSHMLVWTSTFGNVKMKGGFLDRRPCLTDAKG